MRFSLVAVALIAALISLSARAADVRFEVEVANDALDGAHDGRLVVYVVGPNRRLHRDERPAAWDYCHEPMPVYAKDVQQLQGGGRVTVDASADHFLTPMNELAPGTYLAQAVFDWHHDASGWEMEPGNVSSPIVKFDVKAGEPVSVPLRLSEVVHDTKLDELGTALVEVRSKLLSDFAHRDVTLRAGVALPLFYKPDGTYAAIYEIPGFGGRHTDAAGAAELRAKLKEKPASDARSVAMRTFHIFLDPESPNGHTLFADSDVNGPYGRALVEELIPAIEKQFPSLVAEPWARMLAGHSSGGWAACWLQTHYSDTFGGTWASSPDPLDFRSFERIDLYGSDNFYAKDGVELPSVRDAKGKVTLHVRDENVWEETVAPNNTGGQQWQSWQAVFGVPRGDGFPKSLYDIHSGAINKSQLEHYRQFDQSALLRAEPARYAPIWREKIRVIVGGADDYYLNEAVQRMADELAKLPATGRAETNRGYVKVVPGKTHDTIYETPEMLAFQSEMLEHLNVHQH